MISCAAIDCGFSTQEADDAALHVMDEHGVSYADAMEWLRDTEERNI